MCNGHNNQEQLYRIRHSLAHIMAEAMLERFPEAKIAIGPPIDEGFYYDFDLPRAINDDDIAHVQDRMRQIIKEDHAFSVREISPEEGRALFKDQPYKLELIDDLVSGRVDDNGNPIAQPADKLTVYTQDTFTDLCRGPHVKSTGEINPDAFDIAYKPPAGAYWRGDENRPQLTRIYGTAWESKAELDDYLNLLEEIKKRDHRRLGRELELYFFDPTAPGMPYWLPNGLRVLNTLMKYWREIHDEHRYEEVATPMINRRELYDTSGHWDHYRDNMFIIEESDHVTYCVKPMNCPNAMVVFNMKTRSYRDLPMRLSDCSVLHRNERSGALHGLMRAVRFQQDDAHLFVTEEQIESEFDHVIALIGEFYQAFGLEYRLRLGLRPEKFMGEIALWDKAEAMLERILDKHIGPGQYEVALADGAFYGPKVDIVMKDGLGRDWQMGTIQLDYQLPRRFGCTYIDKDGNQQTPAVIHRAIFGSLERFLGVLIEHCAGALPLWLAPIQARIIPIADRHIDYAYDVLEQLKAADIYAEIDQSNERMGAKIRNAQLAKIPYMMILGDREQAAESVSVRLRTEEDLGMMPVSAVIMQMEEAIQEKRYN